MLIIQVTNVREVMRKRLGSLGERIIGKVLDSEAEVEKALIQEMEAAFQEFGIEAKIVSVKGPNFVFGENLELPLRVREEKQVRLARD